MQNELQKISTWFKSNKLSLNVNKTKMTLFHPASKKKSIPNNLPTLAIDNISIHRESVIKFLGVYIDENITWKHHINVISTKISKSIGILYNARQILDKNLLKQLYFALIHNYLNYANVAWGSTHKSKLEHLYRQQKHAARIINFKDKFTRASPLMRDMCALSIYDLNVFNIICLMYKCKNNLSPLISRDLYTVKPENKYTLRGEGNLFEPLCKKSSSQFCITFRGPHIWNKVILKNNKHIANYTNFSLFKHHLKK